MNSNIYENDDVHQHFQHFKIQQPSLHKEEYKNINDMTTTNWDRTPIRRNNFVSGPQSAFARLFPDKYRQQEELLNTQRSKSSDNRHLNINHRITIQHSETDDDVDDDENYTVRKSRRVRFYPNDDDDDDCCLKNRTKSEPHLNQIHLNNDINYDPNPEIIYRDNPDDVTYTQRVGVRYLKPPTPPPPGPILIREMQSSPPAALPPLVVSTTP